MEKKDATSLLKPEEQKILSEFEENGHPGLSPQLAMDFFALFLNGSSLSEVSRLNPVIKFGAILQAYVKFGWEDKKEQYMSDLQNNAMQKMMQSQLESADFISTVMSATHKRYGSALKKFIVSGNVSDLEGFDISGIQSYSKLIETFMKITGQDSKKTLEVRGNLGTTGNNIKDVLEQAPSPEMAAKLLAVLSSNENK